MLTPVSATFPDRPLLLDQRHILGDTEMATQQQVQTFWEQRATAVQARSGHPFPVRPERGGFVTDDEHTLVARVEHSRWIADCVAEGCRAGVALWREHDRAACLDCGTVYTRVEWPDETEVAAAERALAARPEPNRHWSPADEDAEQLRRENIQHGYPPERAR